MSEERKKRVEKSRDPNVWKKWLEECVVTSSEVEQNDESEDEELQKSDHESTSGQGRQRMDTSVNKFNVQSDNEEDSGSDEESGDSSDEELESGEEEEESDDGEDVEGIGVDENPDAISSDDSTGSSGRERCPICLNKFVGQDLGTPESCEHTFCFECIQEWSRNINTCPIDRTEFNNIHVRNTPDGNVVKRVKVKVRPKEAEDAPPESVTLCEVCHHGDREDRLLLCDGCDLAYHCECLDAPLFYIPIEEWFCPPCSGILQNGAVAAARPSHSRARRVIPRTRASEEVRSRVQNLRRTQKSPAPRSTSSVSRKSTTPVKRRRRRTYKRMYKKVVQLARTKKSMSDAGKGKTAARGTTVVVTYRRRRRRRRRKCGTKKLSKRSQASSKALLGPSAQQRIAKRLGISKSFDGSTMPQVKKPTSGGYRLGSRTDKTPSHSLFGNRNQLMDFSENFNEVDINAPSTSSAVPLNRRSSEDIVPSVSAPVNILDSILAGQTLLHSKSDNVVIKNDGSLVLKTTGTNTKKVEVPKKSEVGQSSRTPMSVALVKEGAKSLILEKLLRKENNEKKSTKEYIRSGESSKSHSSKTSSSQSKRISHKTSSTASSSNHKSSTKQSKDFKLFDEEKHKKSTLSTFKIPKKKPERCKASEISSSSNVEDLNSITDYLQSDWESESSNSVNSDALNNRTSSVDIKKEKYSKYNKDSGHSSIVSDFDSADRLDRYNVSTQNVVNYNPSSVKSFQTTAPTFIKKEVESDQKADSNLCENAGIVCIKQEILSDEETNVDCGIKNTVDITKQKSEENNTVSIKKEPVDSDTNASKACNFGNENVNDDASESENSDYDASQSIIDSASSNPIYSSQYDKGKRKIPYIKIKEEITSDSEEYSQSLVSNIDVNLDSEPLSHNTFLEKSSQLKAKNAHISELSNDLSNESLPCTQMESYPTINHIITPDCAAPNTKNNDLHPGVEKLPSTQISSLEYDSSEIKRSQKVPKDVSSHGRNDHISSDDDFPPTQINPASESSKESSSDESDDELPPTQMNPVLNAFSISNTSFSTGNIQKNVSSNPQIKPFSSEKTSPTQTNGSILSNKGMSGLSPKPSVQSKKNVYQPETLAVFDTDETVPATKILSAPKEKSNLPIIQTDTLKEKSSTSSERRIIWTSICGKDSTKKSDNTAVYKKSSLTGEKSRSTPKKIAKVPETQVNEPFSFPATQILDESSNEPCASPPLETFNSPVSEPPDLPNTQVCDEDVVESSLPATKIFDANFKEPSLFEAQIFDSMFKDSSLPATQIIDATFKEPSLPATQIFDSIFKELPLPATKIIDPTFKEPSTLSVTQILDETSVSSTLPATQIFDSTLKEPSSLPETQMLDYTSIEPSTLPATQILDSSLNESSDNSRDNTKSCKNMVSNLRSSPHNQVQNKSITDILSNIKQIVNNLTKKSSDSYSLKCQDDVESTLDCDNSSDSKKLTDTSTNEMDKENSNASNENLEINKNASDSEDEELSPEKLKELLSKPGKVDSPKNVGVHRHLPQVITVKPVKQLLKPKPPNRKTFSFEEVAKLKGPLMRKEYDPSETNLDNSCIENDLPATQLAMWPERNKNDLLETQLTLNGVNNDTFQVHMASSLSNHNLKTGISAKKISPRKFNGGKEIFPTGDENNLSATQACTLNEKEFLKPNKIKELIDLSDINEVNLPATQIFDSSKRSTKLHKKVKQDIVDLSDGDESNLLVTQVFSFRDENNFLKPFPKIKKESIEYDNDVNNLPATQIEDFRDRSDKSSILSKRGFDVLNCAAQNNQDSFDLIDSNDLPATQLFCDTPVQNLNKFKHSHISNAKIISNDLSAKSKPHQKSAQPAVNEQDKNTRKHIESIDYFKGKYKDCSLNDGIFNLKKQNKNKVSKYFETEKDKSNQDHKRCPKRSHDNEQDEKKLKKSKNILTVSPIKSEPSNSKKIFFSEGRRGNSEKHASNSAKESLSNNIISKKESETMCNLKNTHVIKIKEEKIGDFNFEKPVEVSKVMPSHSYLKNVLKIKLEEPVDDRSLPPTQIVNFDVFDDNSLPPTQIFCSDQGASENITSNSNPKSDYELEILPPVHIKKEVLSDDEVSIIEVENCQEVNVKKEIISIDDDLENTGFGKSASHSPSNSYRKDLSIKVERDMEDCQPCTKKDETGKNTFKNASKSKSDKMAAIDGGKHKNSLDSTLPEKEDKSKHGSISSKSNSKQKDSKNGFREVEKGKHSTDNRLSKENNKSRHSSETLKSKHRESDYCKDVEKCKSSKDSSVSKEGKTMHDNELLKSKSKHGSSKSTCTDVGKRKSSTDSISTKEEMKSKHANELLKSKSKNRDFENNSNSFEILKKSRDSAPVKEDRYKKYETDLKVKSKDLKDTDKTKDSKPSSKGENIHEKHKTGSYSGSRNLKSDKLANFQKDTCPSKHLKSHKVTNSSSDKERLARSSSEKENDNSFKANDDAKERLITLKPSSRKRSHESSNRTDQKKFKSDESSNSTSFSEELSSHLSALQNGSHKNGERTSSVSSMDWNLNDNSHDFLVKESPEPHVKRDVKMISRKQELKEEIANEVKLVLKPFYSTCLISKEDYKDIMRRAVPKIFMNCHNCINPDKIRKLVLSYVSLLNKT